MTPLAFEESKICGRNVATFDDARNESAIFDIDREQNGLKNTLD